MTHPAVAFAFRDAQYSTLSKARPLMDKGFALKARITTDPYTKVIPKAEAPWRQEPAYAPPPVQVPSHTPALAPSTRGSTRPRVPLDYLHVGNPTALIDDHPINEWTIVRLQFHLHPPKYHRQIAVRTVTRANVKPLLKAIGVCLQKSSLGVASILPHEHMKHTNNPQMRVRLPEFLNHHCQEAR